jgi:hypothetical protein
MTGFSGAVSLTRLLTLHPHFWQAIGAWYVWNVAGVFLRPPRASGKSALPPRSWPVQSSIGDDRLRGTSGPGLDPMLRFSTCSLQANAQSEFRSTDLGTNQGELCLHPNQPSRRTLQAPTNLGWNAVPRGANPKSNCPSVASKFAIRYRHQPMK